MIETLEDWLIARVAADAGLRLCEVDAQTPLYRYGLDSRTLAFIVENAERRFGLVADLDRISPAEPISALVRALAPLPA